MCSDINAHKTTCLPFCVSLLHCFASRGKNRNPSLGCFYSEDERAEGVGEHRGTEIEMCVCVYVCVCVCVCEGTGREGSQALSPLLWWFQSRNILVLFVQAGNKCLSESEDGLCAKSVLKCRQSVSRTVNTCLSSRSTEY